MGLTRENKSKNSRGDEICYGLIKESEEFGEFRVFNFIEGFWCGDSQEQQAYAQYSIDYRSFFSFLITS